MPAGVGPHASQHGTALALLLVIAIPVPAAEFAGIFTDHMVLQRDRPVTVWGSGEPGQALTVSLAGTSAAAEADSEGRWRVELPPLPAGGPHELRLHRGGRVIDTVADILAGDVWLCSGQSNMEFPVRRASSDVPGADGAHPDIRLLAVQRASYAAPQAALPGEPEWQAADDASASEFSAACFFFGRELQKSDRVPLGLVHSSWGGSKIEAWMSGAALQRTGGFEQELKLLQHYAQDEQSASTRFARQWEDWWRSDVSAADLPWLSGADAEGFASLPEFVDWKKFGDPELTDHNGMVWFRKTFDLAAGQAGQAATLSLGGVDEVDVTWVNGEFAGTTFGWGTGREYEIPAGVLRPGENVVAVNVLSTWGMGGLLGPPGDVRLSLANGETQSLGEGWRYRRVPANAGMPPRAPWESIAGLTGLFNAMVAPLEGLGFAGVLWYQGESNTGAADSYDELLAALIADWRGRFGESLAFLVVQLPNYGELSFAPTESGWAALRDAQRRVAEADPDTGLVVTIDLGVNSDLHPPNKQGVAGRAAAVARALAAGREREADGISPLKAVRERGSVVVEFDTAHGRLVTVGGSAPVAFETCGDAGCTVAEARLDANRVYLGGGDVDEATRVRYCWADAPLCNLYGESGLPVGTFELSIGR